MKTYNKYEDFPVIKETDKCIQNGKCIDCGSCVGEKHKIDCVMIRKKVNLKATIIIEEDVPFSWKKDMIEYYYNKGTWCADNILEILKKMQKKYGCLCPFVTITTWEDKK